MTTNTASTRTDITIRPLEASDRAGWDGLWDGYLAFYQEQLPQEITEATWQRLISPAEQPYGFAALHEGRIVGFVHYLFHVSTWATKGYCYLEDLFVAETARGLGVGRALIEAVFRAADEYGATRVYWHTEVDNARAQSLYDQLAQQAPYVQYRRKPR